MAPASTNTNSGLPITAASFTVFLCILFGANAVAVKISLGGLGIFTTAGLRFSVAAMTIFLWATFTGKPLFVERRLLFPLFLLSLIFFTQLSLFYFGQNKTTASHGTLLANGLPFGIMILAHFFIPEEKITIRKVIGLSFGFSGVIILIFDNLEQSSQLSGDLLILVAIIVWSVNGVYTKKIISNFHPMQITLYPMAMAAPLFLLCGYFFDEQMIVHVNAEIALSMFYQTFITASFGMVAWNTMIRRYGATAVHSFVFILPFSGVFLGVYLLGEPVTPHLIFSIIMVTIGLLIVNSDGKQN